MDKAHDHRISVHQEPRRKSSLREKLEERQRIIDAAPRETTSQEGSTTMAHSSTQNFSMLEDDSDDDTATERRSSLEDRYDLDSPSLSARVVAAAAAQRGTQRFSMLAGDSDDERAVDSQKRSSIEERFDALEDASTDGLTLNPTTQAANQADVAQDSSFLEDSMSGVLRRASDECAGVALQAPATVDTGRRVVAELLERSPQKVAAWALEQLRELEVGTKHPTVFEIARALREQPFVETHQLAKKVLDGIPELPKSDLAEVVRTALRVNAQLEDPASPAEVTLGAKLASLVEETGLRQRRKEEIDKFKTSIGNQATAVLVEPRIILGTLHELGPEDRIKLQKLLLQTEVVPVEHRGMLEAAVQPGGLMDQADQAIELVDAGWHWALAAFTILELALSFYVRELTCSSQLGTWLLVDSLLSLGVAGGLYCGICHLRPLYEAVRADPGGFYDRGVSAQVDAEQPGALFQHPLEARLEMAVAGSVSSGQYRRGVIGIGVAVLLMVVGLLWLVIGVAASVEAAISGCSSMWFVLVVLIICFRATMFVIATRAVMSVWRLLTKDPTPSVRGYGTMSSSSA